MHFLTAIASVSVVLLSQSCEGWGFAGHQLVASVASKFVLPSAQRKVSNLLGGQELSQVASWADEVKRRPEYRFSSSLHYVNPVDNEPQQCSFNYVSDCPKGFCVVGAIFNYTERLKSPSLSLALSDPGHHAVDLKFLVHYIGDIHQPLHVSGRDRGGNDMRVRFFGASYNLHSIWDSAILSKRINDDFSGSYAKFLDYLIAKIKNEWADETESWNSCQSSAAVKKPMFTVQKYFSSLFRLPQNPTCPDVWALEVNRVNCDTVWPGIVTNADLQADYYQRSVPVLEKLIAQAGVRLAAVLNYAL